jgi:hypothetical protein
MSNRCDLRQFVRSDLVGFVSTRSSVLTAFVSISSLPIVTCSCLYSHFNCILLSLIVLAFNISPFSSSVFPFISVVSFPDAIRVLTRHCHVGIGVGTLCCPFGISANFFVLSI